jgi:hypothetical protein
MRRERNEKAERENWTEGGKRKTEKMEENGRKKRMEGKEALRQE